jgi:glutamate/tyrosine decarboxylase-like PLP-dependent enzyme
MAAFADNRLPTHGLDADAVLSRLDELAVDDRDWRGGRVFSLVYSAGDEVLDLLTRAANRFSAENALNTMAFPSLGWMQHDIVTITAGLLGADRRGADSPAFRGYLTSGGTESLLQATKTARDWGRTTGRTTRPNMVLATSAHAAFEKAAHYFDVEARRVPVRPDGSADVDGFADRIDADTVLLVGSAPSYPQGVIDPIPDIASLARGHGVLCHVDACLGGFLLPFLGTLGHVTKAWDLSVPGVTSISADLHKYGYASKGVSVIVYGDADLGRLQPFVTSNWLGGLYGSPSMAGTRPGGPIAAGWAVLHHLGQDGYLRLAEDAWRATTALRAAIDSAPGIAVRGAPDATVVAFGDDGSGAVDTFALGDALGEWGGWYFDRQTPPDSLHATVHAGHLAAIDELGADLVDAAAELSRTGERAADRSARYGSV